jgi:hypothetical protein
MTGIADSTVQVGNPRNPSLLAVYRAGLAAVVDEMWKDRLCLSLRPEIEPILTLMLETGDHGDAKESLDMFFESHIWDDWDFHRRCRRTVREWMWQIHEAWVRLNVAELKELERRTA